MNGVLNLLTSFDGRVFLLGLQVCLFLELFGGLGISLHQKIVEDQSIDVAVMLLAIGPYRTTCDDRLDGQDKKGYSKVQGYTRLDAEFLLMDIREIPIKCDHHIAGCRSWEGKRSYKAYLFGDLTSATLVSKACLEGVAVEVEEVCDCMRR